LTVIGATDLKAPVGFAGIPIGLVLTLIHLVGIPVTNTSVNPARSIGPALFVGGWALKQLWLFIVAPFVGAVLAATVYTRFRVPILTAREAKVQTRIQSQRLSLLKRAIADLDNNVVLSTQKVIRTSHCKGNELAPVLIRSN
jgi:aquaporin Z